MKKNLYFITSSREYLLVAEDVNESEVMSKMLEFLNEHNFHSWHQRTWETDEGIMIDFGSHTSFFLWGIKK